MVPLLLVCNLYVLFVREVVQAIIPQVLTYENLIKFTAVLELFKLLSLVIQLYWAEVAALLHSLNFIDVSRAVNVVEKLCIVIRFVHELEINTTVTTVLFLNFSSTTLVFSEKRFRLCVDTLRVIV